MPLFPQIRAPAAVKLAVVLLLKSPLHSYDKQQINTALFTRLYELMTTFIVQNAVNNGWLYFFNWKNGKDQLRQCPINN